MGEPWQDGRVMLKIHRLPGLAALAPLALALDRATLAASGPRIASDRPLRPGSLVHYRYGTFGSAYVQTPIGALVPTLRTPSGALVPDQRGTAFEPPSWASDPFVAAGVVELAPARPRLLAGRYFRTATIHEAPTSEVVLAVDIRDARRCVIKSVRDDLTLGDTTLPASSLLLREAEVLRALAGAGVPAVHDTFHEHGRAYLVLEDIEGETFERTIAMRRETQQGVGSVELAAWARELAELLHPHPAVTEGLQDCVRMLMGTSIHKPEVFRNDLRLSRVDYAPDGAPHSS